MNSPIKSSLFPLCIKTDDVTLVRTKGKKSKR